MKTRQLIAMAVGMNQNSGFKNSRAEVEKWAEAYLMTSSPKCSQIIICEAVAVVERANIPIQTREINNAPGLEESAEAA